MGNYRNGTYVAFDGQGEANPANSDWRYFELLKAWQGNDNVSFNFVNSHEKTYNVRNTSTLETLKRRLRERMANSKNMLVIVSADTNRNRGLLNWEIETAVEDFGLPIIVAYADPENKNYNFNLQRYITWWPSKLNEYITYNTALVAHILFSKEKIRKAINHFSVVTKTMPKNSTDTF